ncbi:MAG: signal peptide peptidase SppA [Endomicrobiales bacterium]
MSKRIFPALVILYVLGLVCGIILLTKRPAAPRAPFQRFSTASFSTAKETVAVVEIYGPIYVSQSPSRLAFPRDADRIVKKLHRLNELPNVKAVVLRINSPGGSVAATQEITREIALLRQNKKLVVASLGDVAASGGYYIASQADRIVSDPGTITGSIGVIMQLANVQELFKKLGVRMVTVRSGEHKDIGSPFRELTPAERQMLQSIIDNAYGQFVDAVAEGRKMDRAKVREIADGRIFTGAQAKDLGLVDEFGNSMDAITLATKLAGIKGTPRIIYESESESFLQLFQLFDGAAGIKLMPDFVSERKIRLDYMLE